MKFAKIVFYIAGIWGVLVISPLFFLRHVVETQAPAVAVTHPEFYYGFAALALMWQISFFIIAGDPARYHALMIPPAFAKLGYAAFVIVLNRSGETPSSQLLFAATDTLLAILFLIAFFSVRANVESRRFHQDERD